MVLGEEITAVPGHNCLKCVANITGMCSEYPGCTGVVFVTYGEYIKRRLKGEL